MPIYLGETEKKIPYHKAYLGEQIVYDDSEQLDHSVLVYDHGEYGTGWSFEPKEFGDSHELDDNVLDNVGFDDGLHSITFHGDGVYYDHCYGGIGADKVIDASAYKSLYVKLRTNRIGMPPSCTFAALFTANAEYFNVYTSLGDATITYDDNEDYRYIQAEQEADAILNFELNDNRRIGIGNYIYSKSNVENYRQVGFELFAVYLFREDNWRALARKAGITPSTMALLLEDAATLLASEQAVDYMVKRCTGNFMINALRNETFMTALASSAYKSVVMGNAIWKKFYDLIYNDEFQYKYNANFMPMEWYEVENSSSLEWEAYDHEWKKWTATASQIYTSGQHISPVAYAFTPDHSTYLSSGEIVDANTEFTLEVVPPKAIKPTSITLRYASINSSTGRIQGYWNGAWLNIATIPSELTTAEHTFAITEDKFFTKFRIYAKRWNANNKTIRISYFAISSGEIQGGA